LGLLEMYATQNGFCDFSKYPLEIPIDLSNQTEKLKSVPSSDRLPRLVMVIIAFQDAKHLERLVRAVYLPHHLIIIHLDRVTPLKFERQVNKIATRYSNVVVVKFGMVIYRTDSVSMINYKIMNWLVNVVQLKYDYHLTLDGASFPLYKATTLALYIKNHHRHVWLGQLLHQGKVLAAKNSRQWAYLARKRIIFTAGKKSYQQRTKKIERHGFISSISETIRTNMTKKTNSGNQGIFSYDVVKKLTMSTEVKEMFALAKYGCCCCIEERTWFAATRIIGYKDHALEKASTFQVWGGNITCAPSMNNAILRMNSSICYKSEDASSGSLALQASQNQQINIYIRGDEILHQIKVAKRRGFLFARKFSSEDKGSMQLLNYIQQEVL
jgi:Core-2/I-Branching enzyme